VPPSITGTMSAADRCQGIRRNAGKWAHVSAGRHRMRGRGLWKREKISVIGVPSIARKGASSHWPNKSPPMSAPSSAEPPDSFGQRGGDLCEIIFAGEEGGEGCSERTRTRHCSPLRTISRKPRSSSYTDTTFTDIQIGYDSVRNQFQIRQQSAFFECPPSSRPKKGRIVRRCVVHGGAMILFVGLVLIGGITVLAGIVGIKWTIAWLVLLGIATIATRESDDDRSGREASPSDGTASAIEAS